MAIQVQQQDLYQRGPRVIGEANFDRHCMWGNTFDLTYDQCVYLDDLVAHQPGRPIKYYVYKLSKSTFIQTNCKMEFSAKFTERYLARYLANPLNIRVRCTTWDRGYRVRIKLGLDGRTAILTSGWARAVRRFGLEQNGIYIFRFTYGRNGQLKLLIDPLDP